MTSKTKAVFYMLLFTGIICLIILLMQPLQIFIFESDIDLLFPTGWIALQQRNLLLIIQALMLLVIVPVYILTFVFSWWYRADNKQAKYDPDLVDNTVAEFIWWTVPIIMVTIVAIITWFETYNLDPYKPIASNKKAKEIEVVALQWKWLFIYPEENIAAVNYLEIPLDTPIHFKITSDAPMNSFWIPELGGQIYAMPGMQTELYLIANKEGECRGSSANISGEGFAGMHFPVKITSEIEFDNWVKISKNSASELDFASYQMLAEPSKDLPPQIYRLKDQDLFSMIIMKFMGPTKHKEMKE